MARVKIFLALLLTVFLNGHPGTGEAQSEDAAGGLTGLFRIDRPVEQRDPELEKEIQAILATDRAGRESGRRSKATPLSYPFYPQAGTLGQDLLITNFTDLDANTPQIRDWDCGGYTYDGHRGHDSVIRSFREQLIGVPIFAVLSGRVVTTRDGEPDMNVSWNLGTRPNFVVLDHGDGFTTTYLHMKRGSVAVQPGQTVAAGTQLGLTGSSGVSDWPHLHFESQKDGIWFEPSAGSCRGGESYWTSQPGVLRSLYVADFMMANGEIQYPTLLSFVLDETPRVATFRPGVQTVGQRLDLRNLPAGSSYRVRVLKPRGNTAVEFSGLFGTPELYRIAFANFWFRTNLDTPGTWRFVLDIGGSTVLNAPFTVLPANGRITNRPPKKITVRLEPQRPVADTVMTCRVQTSLLFEDPDYDVIQYRYTWRVNNRVVRTLTSAALSDILATDRFRAGDKVDCSVTPFDGKASGPVARTK